MRASWLLCLVAVGCGSEWPDGARIDVEARWCQGPCDEVELLERRLFDNGNRREVWYIFVWTRVEEGWRVGTFAGEGNSFTDYYILDGEPTDRWFESAPTLEELIEVRRSARLGQKLICGDLFSERWQQVVGGTIEMEYPKSCK